MGYKSKSNRDNWNGPWGYDADGMGHTKRRNEQRAKNWKQEQES